MKGRTTLAMVLAVLSATSVSFGQLSNYSYVALGGTPHDVIYDNARGLAYVSDRTLNRIDVIDVASRTVLAPIATGNMPTGMTLTPDGSQLLVTLTNDYKIGVIDLATRTQTRTIDVYHSWPESSKPLRIDYDSAGNVIWRTGTPNNPYGYAYSLNLSTGVSAPMWTQSALQPYQSYGYSPDRSKWVLMIDSNRASVWDVATQTATPVVYPSGFAKDWADWMDQAVISRDGGTFLISRSGQETREFDSSFNFQKSVNVGTAWGTFGPWGNRAVIVQATFDETPSNKISVLDTQDMQIISTLTLPQTIGMAEYNFGTKPTDLAADGRTFFAVGQSGLYMIDTSDVPEPATLSLLTLGALAMLRRKR